MFINNILFINLDYRTDRLEKIQHQMSLLCDHYPFTVERFSAIKTNPGIIGCGNSHLNCIKIAKENKYPYVWIIEDDFIFTESFDSIIETLKRIDDLIMSKKEKFDVIFLAYNLIYGEPYFGVDFLIKTTDCQTASSYIVCSDYYDTMINNLEEGLELLKQSNGIMHHLYANDQYWKSLQKKDNWVCVNPRFGKQSASYSDNSECFMDYNV
jgi:hypothetical protein